MHVYSISYSIFRSKLTFKSWISTSEKRGPSCPNWGHGGGGLGDLGNARKKTFFFPLMSSLTKSYTYDDRLTPLSVNKMFFKEKRKKHGRWEKGGKCHQGFPAAAANPPSEPGHKCRAPDKYKKCDIYKKIENKKRWHIKQL